MKRAFRIALQLGMVSLLSACGPKPPPPPPAPPAHQLALPPLDALEPIQCSGPAGLADRQPATARGVNLVTGAGSRLHSLSVPPGSVPNGTQVEIESRPGNLLGITASSSGQPFRRLALLSLSYQGCAIPAGKQLYIVEVNSAGVPVSYPYTVPFVNAADESVTVGVQHLSEWVLAAG